MSREALLVSEKKDKIKKIKEKYNNMQMSDDIALKIHRYEIINNVLKTSTALVGIVTAIDFFIPDPLLGLDEIALTAITTLLAGASSFVDKKTEELAKKGNLSIQMQEITNLTRQIANAAQSIKQSRQNIAR